MDKEDDAPRADLGLQEQAAVFVGPTQNARAPTEDGGAFLSRLRGSADLAVRGEGAPGGALSGQQQRAPEDWRQLQVLRETGLVEFVRPGVYRLMRRDA